MICAVSFALITCLGGYIGEDEENDSVSGKPYTKETVEKTWKQIEDYIESDVGISGERPLPEVLSEKEILVRAYSIMLKRGAFQFSFACWQFHLPTIG